jgi:hypothetical protein
MNTNMPKVNRTPWKIFLGAFLMLGLMNTVATFKFHDDPARTLGSLTFFAGMLILAIWLIVSGMKGPKRMPPPPPPRW